MKPFHVSIDQTYVHLKNFSVYFFTTVFISKVKYKSMFLQWLTKALTIKGAWITVVKVFCNTRMTKDGAWHKCGLLSGHYLVLIATKTLYRHDWLGRDYA